MAGEKKTTPVANVAGEWALGKSVGGMVENFCSWGWWWYRHQSPKECPQRRSCMGHEKRDAYKTVFWVLSRAVAWSSTLRISSQAGILESSTLRISSQAGILESSTLRISSQAGILESSTLRISSQAGILESSTLRISSQAGILESSTLRISSQAGILESSAWYGSWVGVLCWEQGVPGLSCTA